ncbi:MAG: stage V sporulation protein AD [Clostridia bacterium]|nr:stage V sporulation protein AD [Clostridia bacterium]
MGQNNTVIFQGEFTVSVIKIKNPPCVLGVGNAVGKEEFDGPLGGYFSFHSDDNRFGMKTWEKSEAEMVKISYNNALSDAGIVSGDVGAIFAGDLMNQCTASAYGLSDTNTPYFGLYGACSTMAEAIMLGALTVSGGNFKAVASCAASHNCTAERQFRFPVEYGGQRTPTSQRTVTAAACMILSQGESCMYVRTVSPGRIFDAGINDINNMGAAMAPAAYDTLFNFFTSTGCAPKDFDLIATGDLGFEGAEILKDLMKEKNYDISAVYNDCGLMIYDREHQDVHAGGSGCGCGAAVLCSYIADKFRNGEFNNVLFIGTGALMSPLTVFQGETIPAIAHLVHFSSKK